MLSIQPIRESDVVTLLNAGRFAGDVEGYIVMEGERYHGHVLFTIMGEEVRLLDSAIEDPALLDGALRACLAAGENRGAVRFSINFSHPPLAAWQNKYCKDAVFPAPIASLWGECTPLPKPED